MTQTHDASPDTLVEPMDDPEPGSTWFVSLAGTILFVALVLAIAVVYFRADNSLVTERVVDARMRALDDMKAQQRQLLSDYQAYQETATDGKPVERIRIPIDRAMELMAAQLAGKPRTDAAGGAK
ncbi:MAG: hypothetical protein U0572_07880 [Phycisphaerales bacterium]